MAKSTVGAVAIKYRRKVLSLYESMQSNGYSIGALAIVLRLTRFRRFKVALPYKSRAARSDLH